MNTKARPPNLSPSGLRATPIRTVEAGALFMEMWIEESKFKEGILLQSST